MPDREKIQAAIETHCRTLNDGDKDGWLRIWAEDAVLEDPVGTEPYRGIERLRTGFWKLIEECSPLRLWLQEEVIICGNEAIAILAADVTLDGKPYRTAPIVDHFTFGADGKIASMRAFWGKRVPR
jgi:steroid delta-isomerase